VQSADGATVRQDGGKLTLILHEVSTTTTSFTDRPERKSGAISTASFVRSFLDFFGGDPPNAGLSSLGVGKGEFTLELSAPRYSPSADTLTYRIRPVGKQGRNLPEKLGPVSLFIDAGGPSWDTRLHLSLATTGNVCKTNGFGDGSTPYVRIPDDSAILNSPHTWIVKPDANEPYEVKVTGSEGILDFGTQVAEGANKNGTTTMVFDWTLSCKTSSSPVLWDITRVRTAASVPDSAVNPNTARCVLLDPDNHARQNGTVIGNAGPLGFGCNALTDSGFHTTAYFKFSG
jgi:hypothetical protein